LLGVSPLRRRSHFEFRVYSLELHGEFTLGRFFDEA
jgi:hypothetical protein